MGPSISLCPSLCFQCPYEVCIPETVQVPVAVEQIVTQTVRGRLLLFC